ncbi:uracil-DNA glycosylase [Niallia sp. NCCP-28]|uniref:uracil-DNA glycosylase n=1 Tax=Niallia sp. NCCP-28 TaxID=2934712 RepID=UPI0020852544|nr:uracil-DNA glycosylase [Niallia sp. NCCP-28]GKU83721.1 uracil-DNA glycosylase [Niallia sp. NCCP-28]
MIDLQLPNDWAKLLEQEKQKLYFQELERYLQKEYEEQLIYPKKEDIFNCLRYTSFNEVKVLILGQDPYHGPNQAHGLSFSVKPGVAIPPSLKNIYKELNEDIGCHIPNNGYLENWAKQGVLLLNTVMTVRAGQANSHRGKGWEIFTDEIIKELNKREEPVIFVLWGKPSQGKIRLIDSNKHQIIMSSHPSPLSAYRGFFGSKPFSKINDTLNRWGKRGIDWCQL